MSCFHCYSSRKPDPDLLERIIARGERLRSAVVETIARNNSFNGDIVQDESPKPSQNQISAFLRGDAMSKKDEIETLETLRSIAPLELCKLTDRTYYSEEPCDCFACTEYRDQGYTNTNAITQKIQDKYRAESGAYWKFVDSVKVAIGSVVLNEAGEKKVASASSKNKAGNTTQTFFLEYQIPESLSFPRARRKTDSGLDSGSSARLCSRRSPQQVINFKQTSVHDITTSDATKLEDAVIKFRLSFRTFKQKQPMPLGIAEFHFRSFEAARNFTCFQELALRLKETTPVVVGVLKLSVQLGCGRLYFGKEFIGAVTNDKENSVVLGSDDFSIAVSDSPDGTCSLPKPKPCSQRNARPRPRSEPQKRGPVMLKNEPKVILFGFLYISEAQFSREVLNSYISCDLFVQDEVVNSRTVTFGANPQYNFRQRIPLVYDDAFLAKLRENFMVIEFFEKGEKDFLIGISKLCLHNFYLAYRNVAVIKYLQNKQLPVVASNGWEPIIDPEDEETVGQVLVLLAVGTEEQIEHLEQERGFKRDTVRPKVRQETANVGIQSVMDPEKNIETSLTPKPSTTNIEPQVRSTSVLLDTLHKALSIDTENERDHFKAHVVISNALHLPSRKKCKSRRSKGKSGRHEEILPSTYVTFEGFQGDLRVTSIVPRNVNPTWDYQCDVRLPIEYLTVSQKLMVFKVWRKSTNTTMTPNMQTDHVIGFAAVDLSILLAGLPSVQGWYNIVDLTNKCQGQINIHVTPLENIQKYQTRKEIVCDDFVTETPSTDVADEPNELLSRALKRKFTELDEINQRLRLRLSKVTDESDNSNDELADEFEHDINSLCIEEDFDLIDFEKEAHSFNLNRAKEVGLLKMDDHLAENRQKIDVLLEKLSIFSGEASSRYVSGCSRSDENETAS